MRTTEGSTREVWGSRFGFLMATAGFAIGLGNIWRFPYMAGMNGGGAFLLVYLLCCAFIGIPLLTAEISLGRKAQRMPIAGMRTLTGAKGSPWNLIGWFGVLAALLIMSYYLMLLGWILAYFFNALAGQFAGHSPAEMEALYIAFIRDAPQVFLYTLGAGLILGLFVSRGLQRGVERVAKFLMPLLFALMIGLAVYGLSLPGAGRGLLWYLYPNFSALGAGAVLDALGQAFYSIGIGMAGAFCFGSYLPSEDSDVPGNAVLIVVFDTLAAVLAGLVIFPGLFAFGLDPDAGPGLLFVSMTSLFGQMPGGQIFGSVFFLLMVLAGLTSGMALLEVLSATLAEHMRWSRRRAVWVVTTTLLLLAVPIILSQGPWQDIRVFGRDLFVLVDTVSGNILLTAGALLLALYTATAWGFEPFRTDANKGSGPIKVSQVWKPLVQYLIPAAVALILLSGLGVL